MGGFFIHIFLKFGEVGGSPTSCAQKLLQKPIRSREQCAHKPIKPREQCAHKPIRPLRGPATWGGFILFFCSISTFQSFILHSIFTTYDANFLSNVIPTQCIPRQKFIAFHKASLSCHILENFLEKLLKFSWIYLIPHGNFLCVKNRF